MTLADIERKQWEAIQSTERTLERVVTVLDGMERRMTSIEGNIPSAASITMLEKRTNDLEGKYDQAARPQYQAMTLVLGIIMAVGTLVGYGFNSKIDDIDNRVTASTSTLAQHMSDGHPASLIARVEANRNSVQEEINNNRRETDQLTDRMNRLESSLERKGSL